MGVGWGGETTGTQEVDTSGQEVDTPRPRKHVKKKKKKCSHMAGTPIQITDNTTREYRVVQKPVRPWTVVVRPLVCLVKKNSKHACIYFFGGLMHLSSSGISV